MSVLIFANPYSGRGPNATRVDNLIAALSQRGLEPTVVWERGKRREALAEAGEGCRAVVAAGGDGSVADVINDMHAAGRLGLPFATLPVGTENLFAKEMGFDTTPERLADVIVAGQTQAIDLGEVHQASASAGPQPEPPIRLFTLMTSAGFDADVVHRVDRWRNASADGSLRRVRRESYYKPTLQAMLGYRFPRVALEADGQVFEGGQAYVFNLPRYGGGLGIGKHAESDDGMLDWVVFENPGFINLLGYHLRVLRGNHLKAKTVAHGRSKQVALRAADAGLPPAQTDGDPAGYAPLDVSVRPGALNMLVV